MSNARSPDELMLDESYVKRCMALGTMLSQISPGGGWLMWWHTPSEELGNRSPSEAVDGGDIDLVTQIAIKTFNTPSVV